MILKWCSQSVCKRSIKVNAFSVIFFSYLREMLQIKGKENRKLRILFKRVCNCLCLQCMTFWKIWIILVLNHEGAQWYWQIQNVICYNQKGWEPLFKILINFFQKNFWRALLYCFSMNRSGICCKYWSWRLGYSSHDSCSTGIC